MNDTYDGLWFLTVVVGGATGAAFFIYGIRQKAPLPLALGVLLSVVPVVFHQGWTAALASLGLGTLYLVVRKYVD